MSHQRMKHHLFYTFLAIFIATAVIALLGITGVLKIPDFYLKSLTAALLIELVGAVIALYQKADFFQPEPKADRIEQEKASQSGHVLSKNEILTIEKEPDLQALASYKISREETLQPVLVAPTTAPAFIKKKLETARSLCDYLRECENQVPAAELHPETISNRFVGLPVSWPVEIESIKIIDQKQAEIVASEGIITVHSGAISTVNHPEIKLLRKREMIVLSGRIAKIDSKFQYTLTDSRIETKSDN